MNDSTPLSNPPLLDINKKLVFTARGWGLYTKTDLVLEGPPRDTPFFLSRRSAAVRTLWLESKNHDLSETVTLLDIPWHPNYFRAIASMRRIATGGINRLEMGVGQYPLTLESVINGHSFHKIRERALRYWAICYGFDLADPNTQSLHREALGLYRECLKAWKSPVLAQLFLGVTEGHGYPHSGVHIDKERRIFRNFWTRLISLVVLHPPGAPRDYFLKDLRRIRSLAGVPGLFACVEAVRLLAHANIFEPGGVVRSDIPSQVKEALASLGRSGVLTLLARRDATEYPSFIAPIFLGLRKDLAQRLWGSPWHSFLYHYFARALLRDIFSLPIAYRVSARSHRGAPDRWLQKILGHLKAFGIDCGPGRTQPELDALAQWVLTTKASDLSVLPPNIIYNDPDDIREEERAILSDTRGWQDITVLDGWSSEDPAYYHPMEEFRGWGKRPQCLLHNKSNSARTQLPGPFWSTPLSMLSWALKYMEDGIALYEAHKGQRTARGLQPQKVGGTLRGALKAAHWNHNLVRDLPDEYEGMEGEDRPPMITDIAKLPVLPVSAEDALWMPPVKEMPAEVSDYLVRSKTCLKGLGRILGHCVGTKVDTDHSIFLRKGSVVAQLSLFSGPSKEKPLVAILSECRDAANGITGASRSFSEKVIKEIIPKMESCVVTSDLPDRYFDGEYHPDTFDFGPTYGAVGAGALVVSHAVVSVSIDDGDVPPLKVLYRFVPQEDNRIPVIDLPRGVLPTQVVLTADEAGQTYIENFDNLGMRSTKYLAAVSPRYLGDSGT